MNCEACGHDNVEGARFCANCGVTLPVHTDAENPLVGQVVGGRFRITGVVGEGGMGIVYAGEQQMGTAVRKVAVKTLHKELSNDPSVTARFHRECGTVAQLEHPNTIKVYDFGTMDDGTLYIAMEYLDGKPLEKVLEESGAMPPERVVKLLKQVAGSLEEAHNQGIIHRDLKPENVVLVERAGERDVVKLLDFGIAARTESADADKEAKLTQQGMVLGTPPYMSPEQFTGKALDRRSDIYSLAVMAYEMLTGQLPFDATTPWEWATEHMTAQPRPFETMDVSTNIPPGMRQAILRALSKDREERFATVREFVDAMTHDAVIKTGQMGAADGGGATAAMPAAPDFGAPAGAGPAPTAAMPAHAGPAAASGPGGAGIPAAPPVTSGRRGGADRSKGLIIGLGAVAVVLIAGIGFALVGSGDDGDETAELFPTAEPAAETEEAPGATNTEEEGEDTAELPDDSDPNESDDDELVATDDDDARRDPKTGTASPQPDKGSETPKSDPAPTPPPKPKSPATPPPPKIDPAQACKRCLQLATRGNIISAAAQFRACNDAGQKSRCSARARQRALVAAKAAARSRDCNRARAILGAANSMNAGSGNLNQVVANCK